MSSMSHPHIRQYLKLLTSPPTQAAKLPEVPSVPAQVQPGLGCFHVITRLSQCLTVEQLSRYYTCSHLGTWAEERVILVLHDCVLNKKSINFWLTCLVSRKAK